MKLITYEIKTAFGITQRVGVLRDTEVIDLIHAYSLYLSKIKSSSRAYETAKQIIGKDMLSFIQGGSFSLEAAKTALDFIYSTPAEEVRKNDIGEIFFSLNDVTVRVPLQPVSIRDTLNSEVHFKNSLEVVGISELPALFYERPYYYRTSHTSIAGPEDVIPWPSFGERLDFELEFAAIIGKKGINISAETAHEYIMGYTIFNDISIRDYQRKDMSTSMGPSKCKNFSHGNILGPCIVTSDELDPSNIRLQARINGEVWSDSRSSDMHYSFAQLIEFISKEETLYPGEIICSGTMAFGCGLEINRYLKSNDIIELEVDGIGILRNQIIKF
ncbi:fumarylacetoacetate hydrolase family protein [Brevibacillus centrosporus]|uniref:fumarylacetoacetate hydrolase family protein n=1 Tax=Brevibacillus centrosporus TaxID=54910 RepID=UPI0039884A23